MEKNGVKPVNHVEERLEHLSDVMITEVCSNPSYAQCLLHIKGYRNYHKEEREEFKERIEVLDDRYSKYTSIVDTIQILIIILSASSAFIQAGNTVFGLSESAIQFIGLCVSSWTALTLSISKYYKLDEQKEKMNSLRQQCAELMSELGAREDRLNTLCAKEMWAGPPDGPQPPALAAWENERDEMYNNLKTIIQKKQSLVNDFEHLMDSKESRKLIMRAKTRYITYKNNKLSLTKDLMKYEQNKIEYLKDMEKIVGKPRERKLVEMTQHNTAASYGRQIAASEPAYRSSQSFPVIPKHLSPQQNHNRMLHQTLKQNIVSEIKPESNPKKYMNTCVPSPGQLVSLPVIVPPGSKEVIPIITGRVMSITLDVEYYTYVVAVFNETYGINTKEYTCRFREYTPTNPHCIIEHNEVYFKGENVIEYDTGLTGIIQSVDGQKGLYSINTGNKVINCKVGNIKPSTEVIEVMRNGVDRENVFEIPKNIIISADDHSLATYESESDSDSDSDRGKDKSVKLVIRPESNQHEYKNNDDDNSNDDNNSNDSYP